MAVSAAFFDDTVDFGRISVEDLSGWGEIVVNEQNAEVAVSAEFFDDTVEFGQIRVEDLSGWGEIVVNEQNTENEISTLDRRASTEDMQTKITFADWSRSYAAHLESLNIYNVMQSAPISLPQDLMALVERMTALNPLNRPRDAGDVLKELLRINSPNKVSIKTILNDEANLSSKIKIILILAANPKDTLRLRLDQEVREIDNGLRRAQRRDEFILKQVWAVRHVDFRRALLDLKPNIVHFCGHSSEQQGIALEDESGHTKHINTEALSTLFGLFSDTIECVILNACYSKVQAEAIAKYIPYVIGMNSAIGDVAAIEFSTAFYDALGAGKPIEFAHKLALSSIQLSGPVEDMLPILKSPNIKI